MKISFSRFFWLMMASVTCFASADVQAGDWPHWLGPNGDNMAAEEISFNPDLSRWKVAWKTNVGLGNSSVVVAGGRAFTMGYEAPSNEVVVCFDAATGTLIWRQSYEAQLVALYNPGGPSSTPTVIGDRVLTVSKDGQVFCFAADKGTRLWRADLGDIMGLKVPMWGYACSPVVFGRQVIFMAGKVAALDLKTGQTAWCSTKAYPAAYTTAVVFERAGTKYIAALDGEGLSILSAGDGAEITRHPFKMTHDVTVSTPFVFAQGGKIFISGNIRSEMLAFDGQGLSTLWQSVELKNSLNNSVFYAGAIYGIDEVEAAGQGRFVSVRTTDGSVNWAQAGFPSGNLVGVGRTLLAITEDGELVTILAGSESYQEISRLQILGKTCYAPPTYANRRIYARSNRGDIVCLSPNL